MIGLNTSPNITRFAAHYKVDRQGLVDVLRGAFGNHVDILRMSNAEMVGDVLRISNGGAHIDFGVAFRDYDGLGQLTSLQNTQIKRYLIIVDVSNA